MNLTRNEKIEEMFLELVELPHDQREARMNQLCGSDPAMREELTRLLAADDSRSHADDGGIVGGFVSDPVPQRVGQYIINGVAGEGGMGAVYDALHEPTRRRAAIKLLRVATSTMAGRSRMRIEAETLGRLDSPNIATLYDAGVTEVTYADGRRTHHPFIAMEFVAGRPIVEFAREGNLSDREKLALMQRVAGAVHHAHQRGVIHRDLKPRNVLVAGDGTPKVVDFGIARLIDAAGDSVTQTGQLLGTLRYMSPEQTAGDHRNVDTRSDVYALGAILFELLADRPMVSVDTGASLATAMKILQTTAPGIAQLRPELAGDVDAIVRKATALEVNDRYSSAQALADDLRLFLEGRDITARAPTALERFGRYVRRNKAQVAVAATIAALLIGGIFGTTWGLLRAERARREESKQREAAEASAAAAKSAEADSRAFGRFLVYRVLATARPKDIQGGLGIDVKVVDAIRQAEEHLDSEFAGQPAAEAKARQAIGATWRNRGEFAKAQEQFRRAEALAAGALGPSHELTLDIRNSLLVLLQQMGRNEDGIKLQEEIVKGFTAAYGERDRRTLDTKYNLAIYRARSGDYPTALQMLEQVHAGRSEVMGAEHSDTLTALADIAELNLLLGNADKGVTMQEQLVQTFKRVFGDDNPQTYTAEYRLACLLQRANRVEEAIRLHEAVIPNLARSVGAQNITTLDAKWQLARCYLKMKQPAQAAPLMRDYADGQTKLMGPRSPQFLQMLNRAASSFLEAADLETAEEFARRAVSSGSDTPSQAKVEAQCILGQILAGKGQFAEAEPILATAIEAFGHPANESAKNRKQAAINVLGDIYKQTGRQAQSEALRSGEQAGTTRPTQ